jgi:hypothetical protein
MYYFGEKGYVPEMMLIIKEGSDTFIIRVHSSCFNKITKKWKGKMQKFVFDR